MAMRKTPPQTNIPTVRITARDAKTGKSKSTTVYETTPEEVISTVERLAEKNERRATATSST
jgi:hypothetical protein